MRWLIPALLLLASCELFHTVPSAPPGDYVRVAIPDGSLLVSSGSCGEVDMGVIKSRATVAVHAMQDVWINAYPLSTISVDGMKVVMSVNPGTSAGPANGIYHGDERWIELRCGFESVIEAELYHAIAHRLGLWCWFTIGHGILYGGELHLDCGG